MDRFFIGLVSGALLLLATGPLHATSHAFVDLQGRIFHGEVVSVSPDSVVIKKEDGTSGTYKIADFSPADRAFIQQQAAAKAANLLSNPSFEQGLTGWKENSWRSIGHIALDRQELFEGKPTVRIDSPRPGDTSVSQNVAVKPGARYRMTAWVKTKDLQNPKSKLGANLFSSAGGFVHSSDLLDSGGWKKITFEFTNKDKAELEVGVRVGYYWNPVSGTAWFADVALEEVTEGKK